MRNLGEIVIRPAKAGDEEGILRCLAVAFEPYRAQYTSEGYRDTVLDEVLLRDRLRQMHILVAVYSEGIVGTIAASLGDGEAHLRGMAVMPEWHGNGLAARLLQEIEAWLRNQGCRRVTLNTTLPLKTAMKFYEKNAYRKSGRLSDFFGMPLVEYVKELG
jgi:GNAT superfamily N-acetyltransferase